MLKASHPSFSSIVSLKAKWCSHTVVLVWLQFRRIPIAFYPRSASYLVDNLSIVVHTLPMCMLTLISVNKILLPRYTNWSTIFGGLTFNVEIFIKIHKFYFVCMQIVISRCLPSDRTWHKVNDYSGDLGEGEGQAQAEAWTLLVYAAHWPTKCNVGLISQAVSQTQIWVQAWTSQQGLVLYIGYKGVNVAAHPPKGGPAEAGDLTASNLPLISIPQPAQMLAGPAKAE